LADAQTEPFGAARCIRLVLTDHGEQSPVLGDALQTVVTTIREGDTGADNEVLDCG
jgi:hypothetical protein